MILRKTEFLRNSIFSRFL